MKFTLATAGWRYEKAPKEELEKLGFTFEPVPDAAFLWHITSSSTIEINSLEELMAFVKQWKCVVLWEDKITIYDDYLE